MTVSLLLDLPRFTAPALCAETDPDAFHPEKGGSAREAKRLCGGCPARDECLSYALDRRLVHGWDGVWGGTSPQERRRILRGRERAGVPLATVESSVDVMVDDAPCHAFPSPVSTSEDAVPAVPEPALEPPAPPRPTPIRREDRAPSTNVTARGWADEELAAAVATCSTAGLTRQEIAAELGVSLAAVRRALAFTEPDAA